MIQDSLLQAAVSRINQRSERQSDIGKLVGTYVDVGLLPQLRNTNHQIFYGRRGTGKTHVMKVLESSLAQDPHVTVVYIDCRTLGSTTQFSDTSLPINRRCLALFRDFLLLVHQSLLEHIIEHPSEGAEKAFEAADFLATIVTEPLSTLKAQRVATEVNLSHEQNRTLGIKASVSGTTPSFSANASATTQQGEDEKRNTEYLVDSEDKIIFPELHRSLGEVLRLAETQLYVLIDEWSSLPSDVHRISPSS